MVDIQTVSIAIASASVVAGVAYYAFQIRHQTKVRQTDITFRLYSQVCTKEFMEAAHGFLSTEYKDYDDFVKRYGDYFSKKPVPIAFNIVGMFHEGIGVLLHRKLVDVDLIWELFAVRMYWEKMKPIVEGLRKQFNQPNLYEWFEYLYNEVKKREQQASKKA